MFSKCFSNAMLLFRKSCVKAVNSWLRNTLLIQYLLSDEILSIYSVIILTLFVFLTC